REIVEARTPAEAALLAVWREVLGHDTIGVTDNFFEVGGDSLSALRVLALSRQLHISVQIESVLKGIPIGDAIQEQCQADSTGLVNSVAEFTSIFTDMDASKDSK
ncbi:phosphopantetheine-binding protein, partial [Acetobacter senegalensis]|uniref:phosphopantetheine-binding protein n=1 Tax=Acetobacter senegalensis TaxID=446692 RepID=UPI00209D4A59